LRADARIENTKAHKMYIQKLKACQNYMDKNTDFMTTGAEVKHGLALPTLRMQETIVPRAMFVHKSFKKFPSYKFILLVRGIFCLEFQ
jgi:hypothetical protein